MKNFIKFTLAILAIGVPVSAQQSSATAVDVPASATIISAISIVNTAGMDFGQVVPGASLGTVVLTAGASPTRTGAPVGGPTLGNSTSVSSAEFDVSGQASSTYSITLPSSPVTLTSGGNNMTVTAFSSSPSSTGTLDGSGEQVLYVGGTLNVGAAQVAGVYTGVFDVTVAYN